MHKTNGIVGIICTAAALAAATGCESGHQQAQIDALTQRVGELRRENGDLLTELASAQRAIQAERGTAAEFRRALSAARDQLSLLRDQPVLPDGWNVESGGTIVWTSLGEEILFDAGRATLKATGKQALQKIVDEVAQMPGDRNIWIVGHTDSDKIAKSRKLWKDNLDLSQGRARVVALELLALGVDAKRVIAGGQGESNPIVPNDTKTNKAKNRRVQIFAVLRPNSQG